MSRLLEKYEINIWMYGYTQIQGTRSKKMEKYRKNLSRTFKKNLDIVPWIGEYPYTQMLIWYFSNNFAIYEYV